VLMFYAIEESAGPLAGRVSDTVWSTQTVQENDDIEASEEFWEEVHELFANFMLLLIVLHVAGVLYSSHADKDNLVKAMITGRKRVN